MQKDKTIQQLVDYLTGMFGADRFIVRDYWNGDLCAIGFENLGSTSLLYVNTYNKAPQQFYLELEDISVFGSHSVNQRIDNVTLNQIEDYMRRFIVGATS